MTIEYSCNACLKPSLHYVNMDIMIGENTIAGELKTMKLQGWYCNEHLKERLNHIIKFVDKPHVKSNNPMENKK
jgi:hypothetical protein